MTSYVIVLQHNDYTRHKLVTANDLDEAIKLVKDDFRLKFLGECTIVGVKLGQFTTLEHAHA